MTLHVQRASRAAHIPSDATLRKWARAAGIEGLAFVKLTGADVVRHKIVADIVAAYEKQPPTPT